MYRGSDEMDEMKHAMEFKEMRLVPGPGGAGRFRGAAGCDISFGPKEHPITVIYPCDGQHFAAKGVRGGDNGTCAEGWHVSANGLETKLPNVTQIEIKKGEQIRGVDSSGAGYGDPLQRDPRRVLHDVLEKWETPQRAREIYGVAFIGSLDDASLAADGTATAAVRA